ncbi:hypothetical protein N7541_000458 [Penicillium brevicompactum]|uniref:Uncharacterized protein n=1 Tax=Penicillium brevicompactum TaxID=5074 RepID=A0A9W9RU50_PENBR|nr:hypothetical protein N7541_000458 [Penicillium brevicompactum]
MVSSMAMLHLVLTLAPYVPGWPFLQEWPSKFGWPFGSREPFEGDGLIEYGKCQAGCATLVMACYAGEGAAWGDTLGKTAPPPVKACNSNFGDCQAECAKRWL